MTELGVSILPEDNDELTVPVPGLDLPVILLEDNDELVSKVEIHTSVPVP